MATSENSRASCMLAEDVRRYYLNTMGIQVWQSLEQQPDEMETKAPANRDVIWQQLEQAVSD